MRRHSGLLGHFLLTHGIVDQKSPNFAPWGLVGASGMIVYGERGGIMLGMRKRQIGEQPVVNSQDKGLDVKLEAVQLILSGNTLSGTARKLGMALSTVKRWLKDERFQELMREGRDRLCEQIFGLKAHFQVELLQDPKADPKVKAMVVNELERTWCKLKTVEMQRIKAPRQHITVGFEAADGRRVAVQVGGQARALPAGDDDSGTDTDD